MRKWHGIKALYILVAILASAHSAHALSQPPKNQTSIYASSINWNDETGMQKLLTAVPSWYHDVLQQLFAAYLHPEQEKLPATDNAEQYNALYINTHWGPLNNPFNQYQRPSKVFLFFSNTELVKYYMAPIVQDASDHNYYVFDRTKSQPVLLATWIEELRYQNTDTADIKINICARYGNLPTDTCEATSYQQETQYANSFITQAQLAASKYNNKMSAYRDINQHWQLYANQFHAFTDHQNTPSIADEKVEWRNISERKRLLETVAAWPSINDIRSNFVKIRDLRYYDDEEMLHFKRRVTWLYPDDGCWTRSAAVIKDFFGSYHNQIVNPFQRPSKIFAFGNLCANTTNAPDGRVTWWYHTAPIIRDAGTNQSYVLDPSIDPYQPTPVDTWIALISAKQGACKHSKSSVSSFSICNGYGTAPYDVCNDPSQIDTTYEAMPSLNQSTYRRYERERQTDLNRDPNQVLGEQAPWLDGLAEKR